VTRAKLAISIIIILAAAFWIWFNVAANYDYSALSGTYVLQNRAERCTLRLRADQTFAQEINRSGKIEKSVGTWHRYGESHVSFSSEFLQLSGEELNAAGEAHGDFGKKFGIFPMLNLAPLPGGPVFYRKLLG